MLKTTAKVGEIWRWTIVLTNWPIEIDVIARVLKKNRKSVTIAILQQYVYRVADVWQDCPKDRLKKGKRISKC